MLLFVLLGLVAFLVFWLIKSDPHWNADQSWARIEATLNPIELQAWATNLLVKYAADPNFDGHLDVREAVPVGLKKIWKGREPTITLRNRVNAQEWVRVEWGSGMLGRWGLAIGQPSFVLVPGMETDPSDKQPMPWKPGIYFYEHYH